MQNIGIIGLGIMGQRMLQAAYRHDKFHVLSVWDLDKAAIDKTLSKYSDINSSSSAEDLT